MFDPNLLSRAIGGDQEVYAEIIRYFFPILKKISSSYFLMGGDQDDLFQEGLIGLYKATCSYDKSKNDDFVKYAKICIHRAMINAIKNDSRQKHALLNSSVEFSEDLELVHGSPEDTVMQKEVLLDVYEKIEEQLSDTERKVLALYLEGRSYKEIGALIGKNAKAVSNAISRIRNKLH